MAATSPGSAGGNFLTHKLGPLPVWVWGGLGISAAYFYQQRKAASQASSTQASDAATSALANQGAAALQYGYTAPDLASMISNLQGQVSQLGGGNTGTTASASTSPGSTGNPATGPVNPTQRLQGSGYFTGQASDIIYGQAGHKYQWVPNPAVLGSFPKGTAIWFEPVPGFFQQYETLGGKNTGVRLASGTPLYVQVG